MLVHPLRGLGRGEEGIGFVGKGNYGVGWALLMSATIYAGSGQYLGVSLLATGASLTQAAFLLGGLLMTRLLFIYNPASGTGQAKNALAPVLDVFTKAGWITTSYPTQCKGDAARTARELAGQFERVGEVGACAGGEKRVE